jgi:carbonic anhydrase
MKLTKGVIIGQVVFLAAVSGVLVTQLKGAGKKHETPALSQPAEAKAEDHAAGHDQPSAHAEARSGPHDPKKDPHARPGAPGPHALGDDPKAIARELLEGNGRFASGHQSPVDLTAQREGAAEGQHPAAMVLGCSDSRVPPELVFDRGLGELFVVRSAGNIAEPVSVGSLEYGAEHLHAKVIVILGHDKCGAVQAALADSKMPTDSLETLVGYISPALKPLKGWAEGPELVRLGVEANVRRQGEELLRRSPLLRKAVAKNEILLLRAVYDVDTGRVRPL